MIFFSLDFIKDLISCHKRLALAMGTISGNTCIKDTNHLRIMLAREKVIKVFQIKQLRCKLYVNHTSL